jgi:hypothetical protein
MYNGCGRVVKGARHKAKRLVVQCINGVSSNPVEGRTTICQLKDLILIYITIETKEIARIGYNRFFFIRTPVKALVICTSVLTRVLVRKINLHIQYGPLLLFQ